MDECYQMRCNIVGFGSFLTLWRMYNNIKHHTVNPHASPIGSFQDCCDGHALGATCVASSTVECLPAYCSV
jgi:hypothetical protein